jgi:putative heme-binding domain-containing protein
LFDAFEKHADEATGVRLVEALKKSPVVASLPPDWIAQKLAKFPEAVRKAAQALPSASQGDALTQRKHLEETLASLKGGDIRRGQAVFNDAKVACVSCHTMGYVGGKIGPDLTSIGQVRTETDLLEAILYPSASFVRSFEPIIVKTKDGEVHTGVLRGDNEEGVLLVSGPNAEERIARAVIEDMRPGSVSIMPAGLESQLSRQEVADLLAFLKATKWGAN